MYLNVILTIFTITLITMTILFVIWWKKYGKKIFNSMKDVKTVIPESLIKDLQGQANIGEMMDRLRKINQMFGKK